MFDQFWKYPVLVAAMIQPVAGNFEYRTKQTGSTLVLFELYRPGAPFVTTG